MEELAEQFYNKMRKEIDDYEKECKEKGIDFVFNNAYEIALMSELEYLFTDFMYENSEDYEDDMTELLEIPNACKSIIEYYKNFNHIERYNFFDFDTLLDEIVESFITNYGKEKIDWK